MSISTNSLVVKNTYLSLPFAKEIIEIAKDFNVEVYFVGGCLRDIILGKTIKDVDITIFGMEYENFAKILSKKIKAFNIGFKDNVRLTKNNIIIDISKPRGKNIKEDLEKRDFTINNLACDIYGNLIGNINDLENRKIKTVSNISFDDDPLRILRAFRFIATLGFDIDSNTFNMAKDKAYMLKNIAKERITEELQKFFFGNYLEKATNIIKESGVLEIIFQKNPLDYISILRLKNKSFAIYLLLLCGFDIENLVLPNKDIKLINYLYNSISDCLNYPKLNKEEKLSFLWHHYKDFYPLKDFITSKYENLSNEFNEAEKLRNLLNIENAKMVNGDLLKKLGFKPGAIFNIIINDVSEKLALNIVKVEEINDYIIKKYKDN